MECKVEPERNPKCHQPLRTSETTTLPQASQRVMLQGNYLKQCKNGKETDSETVKYMSTLPNYLKRRKNLPEKVLNVGVLDWGHVEKWKNISTEASPRSSSYSQSISSTSSSYSADQSTVASRRGHSSSSACERTTGPLLQLHRMTSRKEDQSSTVKLVRKGDSNIEGLKAAPGNSMDKHESTRGMPYLKSYPDTKLKQKKGKEIHFKSGTGSRTASNAVNIKEASCAAEQLENRIRQEKKREENLRQQNLHAVDRDVSRRPKEVVCFPRDFSPFKHTGECTLSDSGPILGRRSAETSRKSIFEASSDIGESCQLSGETDRIINLHVKQKSLADAESVNRPSDARHSVLRSAKVGISPSKGRNPQDKISFMTWTRSRANELSKGLDLKTGKAAVEKPRSTSPFRRLSISLGKVGKSSGSKDNLAGAQSNSASKSVTENAIPSASCDTSSGDRPSSVGKSRSSPLRRLLDPLLRPKTAPCDHNNEPLQKGFTSKNGTCKPASGQVGPSNSQPSKAKIEMTSCRATSVNDSCQSRKYGLVATQAILRVTFKNGLPLITFAVDNDSDVLVATVKKCNSSGKDECNWMYTFFAIREIKKKNVSWINQGGKGKGKGHDYISNVIAQMTVYDAQFSDLSRENPLGQCNVREFVLFSVDLKQGDWQTSEYQRKDELAAVVMKIPRKMVEESSREGVPGVTDHPDLGGNLLNKSFPVTQDLVSATVILPSGVHSIPSRGIPSSLIDRWKSGGSCDCGGWDLGCKLRILSNQSQVKEKSSPRTGSNCNQFELFYQGGQENKPIFSLAPFKDGVFSVEINSPLTLLQAFSACIAILDSRKLFEISESLDSFDDKALGKCKMME